MYPLLYEVGIEAGFEVNCQPFSYKGSLVGWQELQEIDFWYLPREYESDGWHIFRQAAVLIEHENACDFNSKREDFLKLCMFASKLRVFMGYCHKEAEADEHARMLMSFYDEHKYEQLADGETLVMISWDDVAPQEWIAWVIRGVGNSWERIGTG
jgi:hypothetical protein